MSTVAPALPETPDRSLEPDPVVDDHGFKRSMALAWTLGLTDWKLRFYGSALGYVWTLARPFAFFGVVYFVFTEIVDLGEDVRFYGVYILFGLVLFGFFGEVTSNAVTSLVSRENLLRKMSFNPIVVPASVVVTSLLNLGMTLVAVFIFAFANGVPVQWNWLELPVLLLLLAMFASGIGMFLSAMFVRYRDVQPIWEVVTQMLFYASPILYVATVVPPQYQGAYLCNPLAAILTELRAAVLDPGATHAWDAIGDPIRIAIPLAVVVVTFVGGLLIFIREAPRLAERL